MSGILSDPIFAIAGALFAVLLLWRSYGRARDSRMCAKSSACATICTSSCLGRRRRALAVNGRLSPFVDITASVNRLARSQRGATRSPSSPSAPPPAIVGELVRRACAARCPRSRLIHTDIDPVRESARPASCSASTPRHCTASRSPTCCGPPIARVMRKHVSTQPMPPSRLRRSRFSSSATTSTGSGWSSTASALTFGGEPAFLTVARDITHRKSLEASLGRGKLQARITLESIGEGVITTDRNGTIDYMNEAAEQLIGGYAQRRYRQAPARSDRRSSTKSTAARSATPLRSA